MSEFEEKVINLLETINTKLDKLLNSGGSSGSSVISRASKTEQSSVKPSAVVEKQEEEEKLKEKPPIEGRRVCPSCGGTDFNEVEDKSHVLHQQGGLKIYAKKTICKKCGYEFPT
ncbi:MAG: hypothetical protein EU543_02945 [Promethearchaeota archaeon]|nr:MAG: hypothetical protein EU543_02945 [Candidatus Lokiarchaeota archaeon]